MQILITCNTSNLLKSKPYQYKHIARSNRYFISKYFELLLYIIADTLTSLGGGEQYEKDTAENNKKASDDLPAIKVNAPSRQISAIPEGMPDFVYDTTLDNRVRARLIETEMNQQV